MTLTGLHLLLTYKCTLACDHCFVWGSPWQEGTMSLADVQHILEEGKALGTVRSIYFEGGEPFLYYATLVAAVEMAVEMGFTVGMVSNAYWGTTEADAENWLRPFAGRLETISLSDDAYHAPNGDGETVRHALAAATRLGIPMGTIAIAQPEGTAESVVGQLPEEESGVMYRGRAAAVLAARAQHQPYSEFTSCPYENLRDPGRIHIDPLGHVHMCQGISIGNLFETPLAEIVAGYDPDTHPITGPLLRKGPLALAQAYDVAHADAYADACHFCDVTRRALRKRFPAILAPDQMYGVPGEEWPEVA